MSRLIYLHGFRSSSKSFKAQLLKQRMTELGLSDHFVAPDLDVSPAQAVASVVSGLQPTVDDVLVGSSLGGFYAIVLAEYAGCHAVLLNPAVNAPRDLASQVGTQQGYHDNVPFEFLPGYIDELRAMQVPAITRPERYFLIAAEGDELLDYREMVSFCHGARQLVLPGSDHGLSDFADHVDAVLSFAGMLPRVSASPSAG
ncbi:MAG: YqiA/YcfP family alpha/beta fold hydrolase [Lautropia sp.]|nr:YqiA/YcfP family alpha/beta fold hydrolase [Lautropia sp.]